MSDSVRGQSVHLQSKWTTIAPPLAPMYFRFASALLLAVLISLAGTNLEKQNLKLRHAVSRQHFRKEALLDLYAFQRLAAQQSGAPQRLIDKLDQDYAAADLPSAAPVKADRKTPHKQRKAPAR